MREYETIFVLEPNQDEASVEAEIEKIRDLIISGGGEIAVLEKWGRRKLAYEIDKQRDGFYVLMYAEIDPQNLPELERNLRLSPNVLRYLLVRPDVKPPKAAQ